MNRHLYQTILISLLIIGMPLTAFANTAGSDPVDMIQSEESLILKNPTDQSLYISLGQAFQLENDQNVHVFVNGRQPAFDVQPFIQNGRTMMPVRAIAEQLGLNVTWDPISRHVTFSNTQHSILLTIESNQALVDGTKVTLDVPAMINNGRTVVPLHFVSQSFGAAVQWFPQGSIVAINTPQVDTSSYLIQAPVIMQKPELVNGCEVTSLTMLLNWAGVSVTKLQLATAVAKDPTPLQADSNGNILYWGDPNKGFVGDITGVTVGYAVYHGPITDLMNQYLPGKAIDLTGSTFQQIINYMKNGKPVVVWTTSFFGPSNNWVSWQSPDGQINATFDEHCVLLVGYDQNKKIVYINDPLDGTAAKAVSMDAFEQSWIQLSSQAVSLK